MMCLPVLEPVQSSTNNFAEDVLSGLAQPQKSIPPKYFYDAKGSRLFDAITELPEYYPTRTEMAMLHEFSDDIAAKTGSGCVLIEPGSGSCTKAKILLNSLKPSAYIPMDISGEHLQAAASEIATAFPWLDVQAVCQDFTQSMQLPPDCPAGKRLAFFPGSSIGNFDPQDAVLFLRMIADMVEFGGNLLIGVDLQKDSATLEAAYNDAQGITAQFNLNLLSRINHELGADFDLSQWRHHAPYNATNNRIEMHLMAQSAQQVTLQGQRFTFTEGETIHTENSYKYTVEQFRALAAQAGFSTENVWIDQQQLFSLHLLKVDE